VTELFRLRYLEMVRLAGLLGADDRGDRGPCRGCRETSIKAFGYAHGDVAKVVVRLPGGGQVASNTFRPS
jgi:hypothetical protein